MMACDCPDWDLPMPCPCCGGSGAFLGILGDLDWYRCRDCGMDFSSDDADLALLEV